MLIHLYYKSHLMYKFTVKRYNNILFYEYIYLYILMIYIIHIILSHIYELYFIRPHKLIIALDVADETVYMGC